MNSSKEKLSNNNNQYEMVKLDVSDWKKTFLNTKSVRCKDRFQTVNHPMVTSGKAFWIDDNNLCIGYKSKNGKIINL